MCPSGWNIGTTHRTPDLASALNEVVGLPGWAAGNDLAVIVTGTGTRTAESYEGSAANAPILHIEWTTTPGVNTPPRVTATGSGGPIGTTASLTAIATDDGLPDPPAALTYSWAQTGGPPITINDPSAASTSAPLDVAGDYTFEVTVSDGELSDTTEVTVTAYDPSTTPVVLTTPIRTGIDDVEELTNGYLYVGSSDLEMAEESGPQTVGMRFEGVALPAGATIVSARIEFTVDEATTGATDLTITITDEVDAAPFGGSRSVTGRPILGDVVSWAPAGWTAIGASGVDQATPDLGALVTGITTRPGWTSGNALAFVISGTGTRVADSFEGGNPPVLVIEYLP